MSPSVALTGAFGGAFAGAFVEGIEALTVVLAIGVVRGWRDTLAGAAAAVVVLALLAALAGPTLAAVPPAALRLGVGTLILLVGLRWLRRAVERAAGRRPQRDEAVAFARTQAAYGGQAASMGFDRVAAGGAFQIVMLEGVEVVFIVAALGTSPPLVSAAMAGAGAALVIVLGLGVALHRPIAAVPENWLKLGVGVLLAAFGTFWTGEGIGAAWPGGDAALLPLAAFWAWVAWVAVRRLAAVA